MAIRAAALIAATLAFAAPATAAFSTRASLVRVVGGVLYDGTTRLFRGADPAWSPDGTLIAFSRSGAVWTANADGTGVRKLTVGSEPAWQPSGVLTVTRGNALLAVALDGETRRIGSGTSAAWSRRGWLARVEDGTIYVGTRALTTGDSPAWRPDGSALAFVREGELWTIGANGSYEARLTNGLGDVRDPAWSPDGARLAFVSGGVIHTFTVADGSFADLAAGEAFAWATVPTARELLPDLDQKAPSNIYLTRRGRRRLLAFRSAVANIGLGPLLIDGSRTRGQRLMTATQLVRQSDGTMRRLPSAGYLRYDISRTHSHWHFHPFERYELWKPGGKRALARDHKQGFCFGDRHPLPGAAAPVFIPGNCGWFKPWLLSVVEGTSVRYVDVYPPEYHGQWIDVTGLRDGRYDLVHRVNPGFALRERSYANDVASVRIALRRGSVRVLKRCPGSVTC